MRPLAPPPYKRHAGTLQGKVGTKTWEILGVLGATWCGVSLDEEYSATKR
jgi:hypothetical protein